KLRQALEAEDTATIATTAHTLKSMVGNFVAAPAFEAALVVETSAKQGEVNPTAIDELETQVKRLQTALHEFLRTLE
ncbi:MAG: Hpt domain-containing protein, partial [Planctomycetota bacterium]